MGFYPRHNEYSGRQQNQVNLIIKRTPSKDIDHKEVLYTGYQLPAGMIISRQDQSQSSIICPPDLKVNMNATSKRSIIDNKQQSST